MAVSSKFGWGLVLVLCSLVSCGESSVPKPSPVNQIPLGKELYLLHCSSCHGENGDRQASGAKNLKISTLNLEDIKKIIEQGKNGMPSFGGVLGSKNKIDSVAAHVITLHQ